MTNVLIAASSPAMRAGLRALLADTSNSVNREVTKVTGGEILLLLDHSLVYECRVARVQIKGATHFRRASHQVTKVRRTSHLLI